MPPAGFELKVTTSERPPTYALYDFGHWDRPYHTFEPYLLNFSRDCLRSMPRSPELSVRLGLTSYNFVHIFISTELAICQVNFIVFILMTI